MWACQACNKRQQNTDHRVYIQTELFNVNTVIRMAVRAQLPAQLHLCGDCGLKAARAVQAALRG